MLLLIHKHAEKLVRVHYKGGDLKVKETDICRNFWDLAEQYPEELICWCEEEFENYLHPESWQEVFHHNLIMASYAVKSDYLPGAIGYIDQLPFVNVSRNLKYATWRMSTDVGGIKGEVLLKFKNLFGPIRDFGLLLNSVAKLGQQNGLFCYSVPQLVKEGLRLSPSGQAQPDTVNVKATASSKELFAFVYSHYKSIRVWLLFWCFMKYENSFPFLTVVRAVFQQKYFKKEVDLSDIVVKSMKPENTGNRIDVIIPTLGRRKYLLQVLEDLKVQSLLPNEVIVVEQNPQSDSQSALTELKTRNWPFNIVHHFTHQTGACNARNIALEEVDADWVFFADDDIRFEPDLLHNSLDELKRLGVPCLNINCKQEGEMTVFHKIKQWGSFGSGTSIVNAGYCKKLRFDEVFEYGFGEDQDYGMQLRYAGCDIIYHPEIETLHLKAPRGGFRELNLPPWQQDKPKPSPTLMIYVRKYYTVHQLKGYKNELFLRYYLMQEIKSPIKYLKMMRERWRKSEEWSEKLEALTIENQKIKMPDEI
ncbi:glycosyltransferase family 2 protein [Salegentibacter sp. F14]